MNRHISKEDRKVVAEHTKACSAPAVIRETQIRATRRHLTPTRTAIIRKVENELVRLWKNWHPWALLVTILNGVSLWKTIGWLLN